MTFAVELISNSDRRSGLLSICKSIYIDLEHFIGREIGDQHLRSCMCIYKTLLFTQVEEGGKQTPQEKPAAVVKYDSQGRLIDEQQMLQEAGLQPGVYVKKNSPGKKQCAIVEEVGNGSLIVRAPGETSTQCISYMQFRDEWTIMYDKTELNDKGVVLDYMENLAKSNQAMTLMREWGKVLGSLEAAQQWVDQRHPTPPFRIETKPEKTVIVLEPVAKNCLFLLPHTTSYACDLPRSDKDKDKRSVKELEVQPLWIDSQARVAGKPLYLKPMFEKTFAEPFWAVKRLEKPDNNDLSEANMRITYLQVSSTFTADGAVSNPSAVAGHSHRSVPALTNKRELEAGEELKVHHFFNKKRPREKTPVMVKDAVKKSKPASSAEI